MVGFGKCRAFYEKMKQNLPTYVFVVALTTLMCYVLFRPDYSPYDIEKERLKKEMDSLIDVEVKIKDSMFILKNLTIKQQIEIDSIKLIKDKLKIIRHEIPNNVANYPVDRIDSTLADYLHPRGH